MRRAFTLVELLVVLAMIAVLLGAVGAGVRAARQRAKISRARVEVQEITNAILSFANYTDDGTLQEVAGRLNDTPAGESSLDFLLGKVTKRGAQVPVLYRAAASADGMFRDPWGHPYRVTVKKGESLVPPGVPVMGVRLFFPNWHRLGKED